MSLTRITLQALILQVLFLFCAHAAEPDWLKPSVNREIRERVSGIQGHQGFQCQGEMVCGISLIPLFYEKRRFAPAWVGPGGPLASAHDLVAALHRAEAEGLDNRDYHLAAIERILPAIREKSAAPHDPSIQADADVLLTDAFLLFASHLVSGRVNPETIHASWEAFSPSIDLAGILEEALESGNVSYALENLTPRHAGYQDLRRKLQVYREIAQNGGWPMVPQGKTLKPGMADGRLETIIRRLLLSMDLPSAAATMHLYDEQLAEAIRRFQMRHGLEEDGILGPKTLAALNVPAADRIRQIELNMERWRWIPRDLGERHILVNIADFKLQMVVHGSTVLARRVIVGRPYRKTPVFSEKMRFLVLNPYWNVPRSIAVKDILPKACESVRYLTDKGIRVFENWRDDAGEIDPMAIDWCRLDRESFGYRLRQDPGPLNSLGRIKFMFPNRYAVYLHDTPDKNLFQRTTRGFSSGCIRVSDPLSLAAMLLKDQDDWTEKKLIDAIAEGKRRVVLLKDPLPVHLLYLTAWVDGDKAIHFAQDIYERDGPLDRALKERPRRRFGGTAPDSQKAVQ